MTAELLQEDHPLEHTAHIWWPRHDYVEQNPEPTEDEPDTDKLLMLDTKVSEQTRLESERCMDGVRAFYRSRSMESELTRHNVFAVQMIIEEAFQNVLRHGNKGDPRKRAVFEWRIDDASGVLKMVFRDSGQGFDFASIISYDPTTDDNLQKPGGRGTMLLKAMSTSFEYSDGGRCLTVYKNLLPDTVAETRAAAAEVLR